MQKDVGCLTLHMCIRASLHVCWQLCNDVVVVVVVVVLQAGHDLKPGCAASHSPIESHCSHIRTPHAHKTNRNQSPHLHGLKNSGLFMNRFSILAVSQVIKITVSEKGKTFSSFF